MKIKKTGNGIKIWSSERDSWRWANKPGSVWPCSSLADKRIYVELSPDGDIVDIKINGKQKGRIDDHELKSFINDILKRNEI
jgi:hypothetical protein